VAVSGCYELSRSEIRSHTESAVRQSNDDMSALRQVDPALVKYQQVSQIATGFDEPRGIAVTFGEAASLYAVGDSGLRVFDAQGHCNYQRQLPEPPYAIALGEDETEWIGLRTGIVAYDTKGNVQAGWTLPGENAYLTSLVVSGEDVWVGDAGNRVVLHYSKSGDLLGRIGEKDEGKGVPGLLLPSPHLDVALGPEQTLIVNNPGRHAVGTYAADGTLKSTWGKPSQEIDGFCGCCNPTDIAVLADGRIVTSEKGLPRVKVCNRDGTLESVVAVPDDFSPKAAGLDLAVDGEGRIYVMDPAAGTVKVFARK